MSSNLNESNNDGEIVVFLSALHHPMGKWEMLDEYINYTLTQTSVYK